MFEEVSRNRLLETDLSDDKELETQRDIFVFQCLVGCRVSDLYKMTYRSIINDAIEYIPRKTKEDDPSGATASHGMPVRKRCRTA